MSDRSMDPATRPFPRRRAERSGLSPAGAQGARPAARPLPAAGRAASDSLLHEVESLLAEARVGERGTRRFRVRSFVPSRQG